jgi:hypothetical protein
MAQAVIRRPLNADDRFQSQISPCGIREGQGGTATGFFPEYFGLPWQFHSTRAPLPGQTEKAYSSSPQG